MPLLDGTAMNPKAGEKRTHESSVSIQAAHQTIIIHRKVVKVGSPI